MKILSKKERRTFSYKGYEYTALATFADTNAGNILGKICRRNINRNTPKGYSWENFIVVAEENDIMTADIFLLNGNPVVPMEDGMCDYRVSVPIL